MVPPIIAVRIVRSALVDPHLQLRDSMTGVTWQFDTEFLQSSWTCIWGNGCQGILDEPSEELAQGCCSVGAELLDEDEARLIAALAATLDPARFEHHDVASDGLFDTATTSGWRTRLVDDACIFLNGPNFAGGAGCALHLAAVDSDESPLDWKPSVCWQLPLRVDRRQGPDGEIATLRRWGRSDWGSGGTTMAWCCTEGPEAYVGTQPVVEELSEEIEALVGTEVFVELRGRLGT